jgi:hypothetical protein
MINCVGGRWRQCRELLICRSAWPPGCRLVSVRNPDDRVIGHVMGMAWLRARPGRCSRVRSYLRCDARSGGPGGLPAGAGGRGLAAGSSGQALVPRFAGPDGGGECVRDAGPAAGATGRGDIGRAPAGGGSPWHPPLAYRWGRRAHQRITGFRAAEHRGLAAQLPLEHATAVIESVSARGELVSVQLYGHPWVMGEYWPMIAPCFQVHAVDDAGDEHEGMPGDWQGPPATRAVAVSGSGHRSTWPARASG